jgi:quercetin dioxygenase-like cupin family protein
MKLIHIASIEKGGSSMIRKSSECQIEYREHMRDGDGTVQLTNFITGPEELNGKGRLFSRITLNPGCSIGYHVHEGDAELFYILKGTAEYSDNGTVKQVTAGDVTICPDGEGHGIANRTDEVVELIAVIVYA